MDTVGVRELRQNASALLKRVQEGESFQITDHGRPIAQLVPNPDGEWDSLVASGWLTPPETDVPYEDSGVTVSIPDGEPTPLEILIEMRDEERP